MTDFTVGQSIFLVFNVNRKSQCQAKITKVGRKWVSVRGDHPHQEWRFNKSTMQIDGGAYFSSGKAYLTKEAWQQAEELAHAHHSLRSEMRHQPRDGVTIDDVYQAAKLLDIDIPERPSHD